jgi:hypothetical protein
VREILRPLSGLLPALEVPHLLSEGETSIFLIVVELHTESQIRGLDRDKGEKGRRRAFNAHGKPLSIYYFLI